MEKNFALRKNLEYFFQNNSRLSFREIGDSKYFFEDLHGEMNVMNENLFDLVTVGYKELGMTFEKAVETFKPYG